MREFGPITVNELIDELIFFRDILKCGNLEIKISGSGTKEDGKVYGVGVSSCGPVEILISSEYKKKTLFSKIFYKGNIIDGEC